MKSMQKTSWLVALLIVAAIGAYAVCAFAGMASKYDATATNAKVTFGANPAGVTELTGLSAQSDIAGTSVKIYARATGVSKYAVVAPFPAAAATNMYLANTSITGADWLVYQHVDGTVDFCKAGTIVTMTNVTLVNGTVSTAGTNGDYVYEIAIAGQLPLESITAGVTNSLLVTSGHLYVSPADSPIYIALTNTAAASLTATIEN
jgi:hypothetical protein